MKDTMLIKEFGETRTIPYSEKAIMDAKKEGHCCWGKGNYVCANAYLGICPKISDISKKTIDKYPFIDGGIQTLDNNGNVDLFYVTACKKYIRMLNESKLDSSERRKALIDLEALYEDVKEERLKALNAGITGQRIR